MLLIRDIYARCEIWHHDILNIRRTRIAQHDGHADISGCRHYSRVWIGFVDIITQRQHALEVSLEHAMGVISDSRQRRKISVLRAAAPPFRVQEVAGLPGFGTVDMQKPHQWLKTVGVGRGAAPLPVAEIWAKDRRHGRAAGWDHLVRRDGQRTSAILPHKAIVEGDEFTPDRGFSGPPECPGRGWDHSGRMSPYPFADTPPRKMHRSNVACQPVAHADFGGKGDTESVFE